MTGLTTVSTPDLEALLEAIQRGTVKCPLTETGLRAFGIGARTSEILALLAGLERPSVEVALRVALAERAHHRAPRLDLVWTGPETTSTTTRDTAVVVRRMFAGAERSVLVGGFRFDHGEDLLKPLHEAMKVRGVRATFFMDIEGDAPADVAEKYAASKIDEFFANNWTFGPPRPDVYYDPRTAVRGPPWASLHAKCVVVDERLTLIGSANFTQRGQERNVEAGVLIEDEEFALALAAQWRSLVEAAVMRRYRG
jgi:phosphatidylserine/phosphatidylglycerophosphate/cardiolipin synthase-like enzyme